MVVTITQTNSAEGILLRVTVTRLFSAKIYFHFSGINFIVSLENSLSGQQHRHKLTKVLP